MGVADRLHALGARRLHLHLVESPGGAGTRAALEDELDRRGFVVATSPAAADGLVVAGAVPSSMSTAVDLVWSQLPGPRAGRTVAACEDAPGAVDDLRAQLLDRSAQREDARARRRDEVSPWLPDDDHEGHGGHDHGGHDHGAMAPGGIPLAGSAEQDRDGLEMDVLVHPLGPVLAHWPGGLELRATLHGDLVADVAVRRHAAPGHAGSAPSRTWTRWDAAARALALTGDARGARWARGRRAVEAGDAESLGRLSRLLNRSVRWGAMPRACAVALSADLDDTEHLAPLPDEELPALLVGHDLGDARLLVAAHAPRLVPAASSPGGADHA